MQELNDSSSDYLMHYGVMGMKWGVRKQQPSSGSTSTYGSQAAVSRNQNAGSSSNSSKAALKERIKEKLRANRAARKEASVAKKEQRAIAKTDKKAQKAIEKLEKKEAKRLEKGRKNPSKLKEEDLDKLIRKMGKEVEVKRLERELKNPPKPSKPQNINMNQNMNNVPPKKVSAGRKVMGQVLSKAGTTVLTTAAIGAATYGVNYALTRREDPSTKFSYKTLANQMAPLKGDGKKKKKDDD